MHLGKHLMLLSSDLNKQLQISGYGNPKRLVELGNPNTCAELKLCLFLLTSAPEKVCCETEVLKKYNRLGRKTFSEIKNVFTKSK